MELLEKRFLKLNVLSLCRSSQFLSVANKIKMQKGSNFKWNDLLRLLMRVCSKKYFNHIHFNRLTFFKFSVGAVCINVVHQNTQREKSSKSEIILIVNF